MNQIQKQQSEYQQKKAMKEQVEDLEIRARKWKAEYEIMEYSMKVENMQEEYTAFREKQLEKIQNMLQQGMKEGIVEEAPADENV